MPVQSGNHQNLAGRRTRSRSSELVLSTAPPTSGILMGEVLLPSPFVLKTEPFKSTKISGRERFEVGLTLRALLWDLWL